MLQNKLALFSALLDHSLSHVVVMDQQSEIVFVNNAWVAFGRENSCLTQEWIGVNYLAICQAAAKAGDKSAAIACEGIRSVLENTREQFSFEYPCHSAEERRWFLMRIIPLTVRDDTFYVIYHDRFMSESELRLSKERLALAADAAQIGIWEYDFKNDRLIWDQWMHQIYGTDPENFPGGYEAWLQSVDPRDLSQIEDGIKLAVDHREPFDTEFRIITPEGRVKYIQAKAQISYNSDGEPCKMIGVNLDVTDRREAEKRIRYLAYYDQLTGLPNKESFSEKVNLELKKAKSNAKFGALLFIDLDQFKKVNDTAGHKTGDLLIKQVADRLRQALVVEGIVSRLGGDEFMVIAPRLFKSHKAASDAAISLSHQLLSCLYKPFQLECFETEISASIGITIFDGETTTFENLLKQSDIAMCSAKQAGRNQFCFYHPKLLEDIAYRTQIDRDLRQAISSDQLSLHLQPQIDDNRGIIGAEALLRWQGPLGKQIGPAEFIPIAEESGLIIPIGNWVLDKACQQLGKWKADPEFCKLQLSINISAKQLQSHTFVKDVMDAIQQYQIDPKLLKFELTESVLLEDTNKTIEKMKALNSLGICFSLDDFGTGYSCLSYLKRLPLCVIKIDRTFVTDILNDENDIAIARTIVALAGVLGLQVVAEGVELRDQIICLRDMGCQCFQGFYYSRPLPIDLFEDYVLNLKKNVISG